VLVGVPTLYPFRSSSVGVLPLIEIKNDRGPYVM
jgi:hypothetical protein